MRSHLVITSTDNDTLLSALQGVNRPVWLCDDIFAAVDVHTAALLLDTLQGPLLAGKTRIVATRHQPCITAADMVVTLGSGAIQCIGEQLPCCADCGLRLC